MLRKHREAELRKPLECRGLPENYPPAVAATNPWTGQIIVAALYEPGKKTGTVIYVDPGKCYFDEGQQWAEDGWDFLEVTYERELLMCVWDIIAKHPTARLESFNGRGFDGQYLFVRSYIHGVRCTDNLIPYRYSTADHLDLYDCLGFWERGKTPGLDVVCRTAGIQSPKSGMKGSDVQRAWDEGRVLEIARYCAKDVIATAEAVERWDSTVGKVFGQRNKY
jgi:hypothetical protein